MKSTSCSTAQMNTGCSPLVKKQCARTPRTVTLLFFRHEKSRRVTQSAASHIVRKPQRDNQRASACCHRSSLIRSCRTLVSQSSRRRCDGLRRKENRWMCVILGLEVLFPRGCAPIFSPCTTHAHTHTQTSRL